MLDRAFVSKNNGAAVLSRSCRRFQRNGCWFTNVLSTYSEKRFKETFGISRSTYMFLLGRIRNLIEKDTITEEPISPEGRLAICLYRLARGDCYFTIAGMAGIGERTVGYIVNEVRTSIVECLLEDTVKTHAEIRGRIQKQNPRCGGGVTIPLLLVSRRWVSYTN